MEWRKRREGFTLIEMSIVLVIIGLIVGGVLVGRNLISSAEVRATISQIEKYKTAANTFREKFNCIPGDCANAVVLGLGQSGGPGDNGSGDFLIKHGGETWVFLSQDEAKESLNFWYHLARANLYDGPAKGWLNSYNIGDNSALLLPLNRFVPESKIGANGVIIPYTFDDISNNPAKDIAAGNSFALVAPFSFSATGYPLTPNQAFAIDAKIDDGNPRRGWVVTTTSEWRLRASINTSGCSPGTGDAYLNSNVLGCGLVFERAW